MDGWNFEIIRAFYRTFTIALTVIDSDGNSDTTQQEVTLTAAPWLVEVQLTGPDGRVFGWTEVAAPAEGESGNWSLDWSPETAKSGGYKVEARLLRHGQVLATDAVDFEVIGGKTIRAKLVGYDCDSTQWQFIINKIDGGPSAAPSRIHVTWDNGAEEDVPLSNASGKTARYVTTSNLDAKITEATAFIYEKWNGKFQLGQGPC
ncbi:MAG: hypothetical protein KY429_07555 [Actinobacteria bacterium]|nr:hypothetical protein [Actinomycetota bacterium]